MSDSRLQEEVRAMRGELAELKQILEPHLSDAASTQIVSIEVSGPRRAGAVVEAQGLPLYGSSTLKGSQKIVITGPTVDIVLQVLSRMGTGVTAKFTINGKSKDEEFIMRGELEHRPFQYPLSEFGL